MEWIHYWKKDHATNIPSLKLFNFPILLQGRLWRKKCPRLPMWVLACLEAPLEPRYLKARKKSTWATDILQKDLRENFTAAERASEQQHNQGSRRTYLEGRTNSQFTTFYQNALHLTRVHCATFYHSALRHEQHKGGISVRKISTVIKTMYSPYRKKL